MLPKTSASSGFHLEAAEVALTVAAQLLASNSLPAAPPALLLLLFGVDWPTDRTPVPMHTAKLL